MHITVFAIKDYLESECYEEGTLSTSTVRHAPFITISREVGAGGHLLGRLVVNQLNQDKKDPPWYLLDGELFEHILNETDLEVALTSLNDEEFHSEMQELFYQLLSRRLPQDVVYHKVFRIMRRLASRGRVIVLGRGGVCATAGLTQGLHFRLVAPLAKRLERLKAKLRVSDDEASKAILERDDARTQLVRHYFDKDISDPHLFHAVWNTGKMPASDIAYSVVGMIADQGKIAVGSIQ